MFVGGVRERLREIGGANEGRRERKTAAGRETKVERGEMGK